MTLYEGLSIYSVTEFARVSFKGFSSANGGQLTFKYLGRARCDQSSPIANYPPTAIFGGIVMYEDTSKPVSFVANDPENDELTITLLTQSYIGELSLSNGVGMYTPPADFSGHVGFQFIANDGEFDSNKGSYFIEVRAVNDAPVVQDVNLTVNAGQVVELELNAVDVDSNDITFTVIDDALQGSYGFDESTNIFTFYAQENASGVEAITYIANDGELNSNIGVISIEIIEPDTPPNPNSPPVLEPLINLIVTEGSEYTYVVKSNDPDSDKLVLAASNFPSFVTVDATVGNQLSFRIRPGYNDSGSYGNILVSVSDGVVSTEGLFEITVENVNRPPVLSVVPDFVVTKGDQWSTQLVAIDPDSDAISYTLTAGPAGLDVSVITGEVFWSSIDSAGFYSVFVTASDTYGATDSKLFSIEVIEPENNPPIITSEPILSTYANTEYYYQVIAQDPDEDLLTYSLVVAPDFISIDGGNGRVVGATSVADIGEHEIVIQASDIHGASTQQNYLLKVLDIPNTPPQFITAPVTNSKLGSVYEYNAIAVDQETQTLSYSLLVAPGDTAVDVATGEIRAQLSPEYGLSDVNLNPMCKPPVGSWLSFEPITKWHWDSTTAQELPAYDQVLMAPVVVQLNDDDLNGVINKDDTPDVVFIGHDSRSSSGVLRALDGATGSELWVQTSIQFYWASNIAAADIDLDGVVEIVGLSENKALTAIDSNGELMWEAEFPALNKGTMGGPSIADINYDGIPEIIYGNSVYSNEGDLIWQGTGSYQGSNSKYDGQIFSFVTVADVHPEFGMEVIVGASMYSASGELLWINTLLGDGYTAVADFNEDEIAEIVHIRKGKVSILNNDGTLLRGPVYISNLRDTYFGGPITIGDMDGDGEPEIGIAGSEFYTVLDTDLTVLWASNTIDASSAITGSGMFDFDQDGRSEIVYADEQYLRIYDGKTGSVRYQLENSSTTGSELPIVVDLDNDQSAEIVLVANTLLSNVDPEKAVRGVRVLEDATSGWANTRSIWNQHSYSVDGVGENGEVIGLLQSGWKLHNTYRVNSYIGLASNDQSDLTVSSIEYDQEQQAISVSVINRGLNSSLTGTTLKLKFLPSPSEELIETVELDPVSSGDTVKVDVSVGMSLNAFTSVEIEILSPENSECDVTNNKIRAAVIVLDVEDEGGLSDRQEYLAYVTPRSVSPIFDPIDESIRFLGETIEFKVSATDEDKGDVVSYSLVNSIAGVMINPQTGVVTILDTTVVNSDFELELIATDLDGNSASMRVPVEVQSNLPPIITSTPPVILLYPADLLSYQVEAFSPIGASLEYSLSGGPDEAHIDAQSGLLNWTVASNQMGPVVFDVVVIDEFGGSDTQKLVYEINTAPQIMPLSNVVIYEGESTSLQVVAFDREEDQLIYSIESGFGGVSVSSVTGEVGINAPVNTVGNWEVIVTVTDVHGASASLEMSITILPIVSNNPPSLEPIPNHKLSAGALLSYMAVAADEDGDLLSFSLLSAPDYLTIHPVTGFISGVVEHLGVAPVTVVVGVSDEQGASDSVSFTIETIVSSENTAPYFVTSPSLRSSNNELYSYSAFAEDNEGDVLTYSLLSGVSNVTVNPSSGTLLGDLYTENPASNLNLNTQCRVEPRAWASLVPVVKWHWTKSDHGLDDGYKNVISPPIVSFVVDTNNDGFVNAGDDPIILFVARVVGTSGFLVAVNGVTGKSVWDNVDISINSHGALAAGDIDDDGVVEIIATRGSSLVAFENDGTLKWTAPSAAVFDGSAPSIADLDGDGLPEIIISRNVYNGDGSLKFSAVGGSHHGNSVRGQFSVAADILGDDQLELIVGASAFSSDGNLLWQNEFVRDGISAVADMTNDGAPEIIVVGGQRISILSAQGELLYGPVVLENPGSYPGGPPTVGDFDGDGYNEIGVATSGSYTVYNHDLSILWSAIAIDNSSGVTGSSSFDFNGDGRVEVVYADQVSFRIFDGATGGVVYEQDYSSGTLYEYPLIVDVDKDGATEIVLVANLTKVSPYNYYGVYILEDKYDRWMPSREVWNQHAYSIDNVNDDGSIPLVQGKSWETHNTFRLNQPLEGNGLEKVDLVVSGLYIDNETNELVVEILNRGLGNLENAAVEFNVVEPYFSGVINQLESMQVEVYRFDISSVELPELIRVELNSNQTSFECDFENNTLESYAFTVGVKDVHGEIDSQRFIVNLAEENTPPNAIAPDAFKVLLGDVSHYQIQAIDENRGDALNYSISSGPDGIIIDSVSGLVSVLDTFETIGITEVEVLIEDLSGASSTVILPVVGSLNLPPQITSIPKATWFGEVSNYNYDYLISGDTFEYHVTAIDPDGGEVQITLNNAPEGMNISAENVITWDIAESQFGEFTFEVIAIDDEGDQDTQELRLLINQYGNLPPVFDEVEAITLVVGEDLNTTVRALDPEGDQVTYRSENIVAIFPGQPVILVDSESGELTFKALPENVGEWYVHIRATDENGSASFIVIPLTVLSAVEQSSFNISSVPTSIAAPEKLYEYQVIVANPTNSDISYSVTSVYENISISDTGLVSWLPSESDVGAELVEINVEDTFGNFATQTYSLAVVDDVRPIVLSAPSSNVLENEQYIYQILAVSPIGNSITYSLEAAPATAVLDTSSGLLAWSPRSSDVGVHTFTVRLTDSSQEYTEQSFNLTVLEASLPNRAPQINGSPLSTAAVNYPYSFSLDASDPDGDELSYTLLEYPVGMTNIGNVISWVPSQSSVGSHIVKMRVSDGQFYIDVEFDLVVNSAISPLELFIETSPKVVEPGQSTEILVSTVGGLGSVSTQLFINDVEYFMQEGRAVVSFNESGRYSIRVLASDNISETETNSYFSVSDSTDTEAPLVVIHNPAASSTVTQPSPVFVTVEDENIAYTRVLLKRRSAEMAESIYEGGHNLSNEQIVTIDTTLLLNGQYDLTVEAIDINGLRSASNVNFLIEGDLKVGNFSFTVNDLNIDMSGIPITVNRTYDSRRKNELLDFGYGWSIDYQNVLVEESSELADGWYQEQEYTQFNADGEIVTIRGTCTYPYAPKLVTVTLPDGEVEKFDTHARIISGGAVSVSNPNCYLVPGREIQFDFIPQGDTSSELIALDGMNLYLTNPEGGDLSIGVTESEPYDVHQYQLITRSGYIYKLDQYFGVKTIEDPNGNILTYSEDGILHSGGKSVTFNRNADGLIDQIVDPRGNVYEYVRDGRNDLVNYLEPSVDNSPVNGTVYTYNSSHGLLEILDPMMRRVVKNIYDDNGRLIAQEDQAGNRKTFDHDLDANSSVVTDLDNRTTVYNYDDEGNVTEEIIFVTSNLYAGDIVTSYTYDANGNQETKTINGKTWVTLHNDDNDVTSSCNPLEECVYYEDYNERGQEGRIVDERNNVYVMGYDSVGNLQTIQSPEVVNPETGELYTPTATNVINIYGQVESTTDLNGLTTTYTYYPNNHDNAGQKRTESNPITGTVTFTYDANNNLLTETRERTVNDELIEETVTYQYDAQDRVTHTYYPDDSFTQTVYDLAGNIDMERDRFGVWTDYTYDAYGRLTYTLYADGSEETRTYTLEGLLETVTDRSNTVMRYEYDDAGRQWKVHNDTVGTFTETQYTKEGWVKYEWDESRNLTEYMYNAAGRREKVIRTTDGVISEHIFTYYPNGELHTETDALKHTTTYVLNSLDQRVETQYHNGTATQTHFNAMGARIRTIDQEHRSVHFGLDALGRLETVTPEVEIDGQAVPDTRYTYDEVGNRLTQTDANNHVTIWAYDYYGRVLSRRLPEGMSESFVYIDGEGCSTDAGLNCAAATSPRLQIHTDFNGDTITTAFDVMGQVVSVSYSKDGTTEVYDYYSNGQLRTVEDGQGQTVYLYDALGRLSTKDTTAINGVSMRYDYDDVGNRTLVEITRDGVITSSTSYTYDSQNRLETATDNTGTTTYTYDLVGNLNTVAYPNGLVTDYDYNSVNQLTDVYTRDALGVLISHYNYALSATGRREIISELDGRTTAYCYDSMYRLSEEVIFENPAVEITESCVQDTSAADYVANYQYDWVGNRTYETVNGVQTAYTYDSNDRLEATGGTSYTYDNNGNTLTETLDGVVKTYTWNAKNKLVALDNAGEQSSYTYDYTGIRASKTAAGVTTQFVVDENRDYAQVLEEVVDGEQVVSYSYGHDLLSQDRAGEYRFYHYDGLGSTRALSDGSGMLTDTYDYEAFGEVLGQEGGTENSYLFTGEQFDGSLDQYYLRARYYDQGVGRFTQMDTWAGKKNEPGTLHKYLYTAADPINFVDPSGNSFIAYALADFGFSVGGAARVRSAGVQAGKSQFQRILFGRPPSDLGIVGEFILDAAINSVIDIVGVEFKNKGAAGTQAHKSLENRIRAYKPIGGITVHPEVFFDKNGEEGTTRDKGTLGIDILIKRNGVNMMGIDLKIGRGFSGKKKREIATRGKIPVVQVFIGVKGK
ncbi:putative Ig domain-containing protein [Saccharophagus degradans]|uniref:putative Ig domain-containing protein n=1 Tax=Saccharophagus degradans TaxID=86304 RepID=UPI002477EDD8|nr:putative Ig domain-containing protein [Saccharophagus degradans]WGO96912.1 putative Ig domain-containing protein [Saccharophagus degradans]